jgi:hypothetical protein
MTNCVTWGDTAIEKSQRFALPQILLEKQIRFIWYLAVRGVDSRDCVR